MSNEFLKRASKTLSKKQEVKEVDIEDEFCKYARKLECLPLKLVLLHLRGFPDRTVLCPGGRVVFFELKRKGKTRTTGQNKYRKILKSFGFTYYTCDNLEQAKLCLNKFLTGKQP